MNKWIACLIFLGATIVIAILAIPLVRVVGGTAWADAVGALSVLAIAVFAAVLATLDRRIERGPRQKLLVQIDIPSAASPKIVPLLLDNDDLVIFKALLRHGKLDFKKLEIRYAGKKIYFRTSNTFKLRFWDKKSYVPRLLKVTEVD